MIKRILFVLLLLGAVQPAIEANQTMLPIEKLLAGLITVSSATTAGVVICDSSLILYDNIQALRRYTKLDDDCRNISYRNVYIRNVATSSIAILGSVGILGVIAYCAKPLYKSMF